MRTYLPEVEEDYAQVRVPEPDVAPSNFYYMVEDRLDSIEEEQTNFGVQLGQNATPS